MGCFLLHGWSIHPPPRPSPARGEGVVRISQISVLPAPSPLAGEGRGGGWLPNRFGKKVQPTEVGWGLPHRFSRQPPMPVPAPAKHENRSNQLVQTSPAGPGVALLDRAHLWELHSHIAVLCRNLPAKFNSARRVPPTSTTRGRAGGVFSRQLVSVNLLVRSEVSRARSSQFSFPHRHSLLQKVIISACESVDYSIWWILLLVLTLPWHEDC